jgi:predicted metal-dependent hydrolase
VDRNGHSDPPLTGDPIDPLAEAEALRSALAEAASRAARLVGALRQFRKEKRVLANAWSSLRQLNLGP